MKCREVAKIVTVSFSGVFLLSGYVSTAGAVIVPMSILALICLVLLPAVAVEIFERVRGRTQNNSLFRTAERYLINVVLTIVTYMVLFVAFIIIWTAYTWIIHVF